MWPVRKRTVDVAGAKKNDGANVQVWKCTGELANQSWQATKK